MSEKLTPWFDGSVKPMRPGVYERNYGPARRFNYFTGKRWMFGAPYPSLAAEYRDLESRAGVLPWRGLVSDPNKDSHD